MKRRNIHIELERKIELYLEGRLNEEEVDALWTELIEREEYVDYLKTAANLREIARREHGITSVPAEKKSTFNIVRENRVRWAGWAAAAILVIAGIFAILKQPASVDMVEPIASIELDYYRSATDTFDTNDEEVQKIIRQAIIYANRGDVEESLNLINRSLEQEERADAKARLLMSSGSILYNNNWYEAAVERFRQIVEMEECEMLLKERAWWYLGNSYFQLNRLDEARYAFQAAYDLNGAYRRVAQSYLRALGP
ncbi:MAG: tetratricopeptide repeat protein [Balneolaceae bacterium]